MRGLGVWVGLGLLSCSSVSPPNHTQKDPQTASTTQKLSKPLSTAMSSTSTNAPLPPLEGALSLGSVLRVVEIAPDDPLLKKAPSLLGLFCIVGEAGLFLKEDGYAQGDAVCGPKKELTHFSHTKLSLVYQIQKDQPSLNPAVVFMGTSVGVGQPFIIYAIGGGDAYLKSAKTLHGLSCIATRELVGDGNGWFSGSAKCGLPVEYMYFSEVSVTLK
jgi:hypothetical protein